MKNMPDFDKPHENMDNPQIYCAYTDLAATDSLVENPRNPNKHPEGQIAALAKIIRHQGWRNPIVVSKRSGFVIKGHGRLLAARMLGLEEVPVDYQDYDNEAAEWADMVADNKIAELSDMEGHELNSLLHELDGQIDLELTGLTAAELDTILSQDDGLEEIPDSVPLDADGETAVTILPFLSFGAKKIYMQPDEAERFTRLLKNYSGKHGNYNGLALELMEYGDSRFRQPAATASDDES